MCVLAVTTPPLLEHDDGSFMDPVWVRPDLWCRLRGQRRRSLRAAAWRRGLYGPSRGLAGPARPGVSLLPRPVGTRRWRWRTSSRWPCCCRPPAPMVWCALVAVSGRLPSLTVEVVPSRVVVVPPALVYGYLFSVRPRRVCHGETTMVTSRPRWRRLVRGKFGGALRIVRRCGFLGVWRNPCHFGTDVVTLVSVAVPS